MAVPGVTIAVIVLGLVWLRDRHKGSFTSDKVSWTMISVATVVFVISVAVLWLFPTYQVASLRGLTAATRFDRENEARKTLAQIAGGLFVLGSLSLSIKTFDLQKLTENIQERGQITDRFTKAIDQLGAMATASAAGQDGKSKANLEVHLGGIYALERIAQDSTRDHWPIMEVLTAYVRENAPIGNDAGGAVAINKPRIDVQAALNVIGRSERGHDPEHRHLDLSSINLQGAELTSANLCRADLTNSYLEGAVLDKAQLRSANFSKAHLEGAYLRGSTLEATYLEGAYLKDADFDKAHMTCAHLGGAHLSLAKNLTDKALIDTFGNMQTELPPGVHRPSSWSVDPTPDQLELCQRRMNPQNGRFCVQESNP